MKKKKIACPLCGFSRLIDADENVKSELKPELQMLGILIIFKNAHSVKIRLGLEK